MKKDKKIVKNMVMFESDMKELKTIADKEGVSVSQIARRLVREYLEKRR